MTSLVWFRRDLRLHDHAPLSAAIKAGDPLILLYIHAPEETAPWAMGGASRAWLHRSLCALQADIEALGGQLIIRRGESSQIVRALCEAHPIKNVYWHRLYEPKLVERDTRIKAELQAQGIAVHAAAGQLLHEPWQIKTQTGEVYRVFTPFWRNASAKLAAQSLDLIAPPSRLRSLDKVSSLTIEALQLQPRIPKGGAWDSGFWKHFTPGEQGARECLSVFQDDAMRHYQVARDRPDQQGTSKLGAHLHFGEISVRTLLDAARKAPVRHQANAEFFLRELGWRDFSNQLLFHFPHISEQNLNPRFAAMPWAKVDPKKLAAWQQGQTGIPIIDAGMRQLWNTGWMHNRVRMLVASFLTKNLRYHWIHGAQWFWDTLVDADLANNSQGWQWSAGTGADAAPYFRIFNPITQAEKFDPNGDYVREFVPELRGIKGKAVHQPWALISAQKYPRPMVELAQSRADALAAFATLKADAVL